jgi:outer membrane lipoprotein LolB
MLRSELLAWMLLSCCLLTACTSFTASTHDHPDHEISGKIALRQESGYASLLFSWRETGDNYTLYLNNPLGQTELTLHGNRQQTTLLRADGTSLTATSAEALLKQSTGWDFPLSDIRFWLQGETTGTEELLATNAEGLPESFRTGPWLVTLKQYRPVEHQLLPHRLVLKQANIEIILLVKQHARFHP